MPFWITARSYGGYAASGALNITNQYSVSASSSQSVSVTEVVPYWRINIALEISGPVNSPLDPNTQITQTLVSRWYEPLAEPKRFKSAVSAAQQQVSGSFFNMITNVTGSIQGWYQPLALPVWPKKGLPIRYQQFLAHEPRYLPKPNVIGTLLATEKNTDLADFELDATEQIPFIDQTAVKVSIVEVPLESGGAGSIVEKNR